MTYDNLSRFELEISVWGKLATWMAVKALLKPHFYRLIEDLYDENMNPIKEEALEEVSDKHSREFARAFFNFLEDQGILLWDEDGREIVGNDFGISKMSDEELRKILEDFDAGKYCHFS